MGLPRNAAQEAVEHGQLHVAHVLLPKRCQLQNSSTKSQYLSQPQMLGIFMQQRQCLFSSGAGRRGISDLALDEQFCSNPNWEIQRWTQPTVTVLGKSYKLHGTAPQLESEVGWCFQPSHHHHFCLQQAKPPTVNAPQLCTLDKMAPQVVCCQTLHCTDPPNRFNMRNVMNNIIHW